VAPNPPTSSCLAEVEVDDYDSDNVLNPSVPSLDEKMRGQGQVGRTSGRSLASLKLAYRPPNQGFFRNDQGSNDLS